MPKMTAFSFFFLAGLLTASSSFAEMTGREIMDKQKSLHKSQSEFELQKMILVDKGGEKETRELRRYAKEVELDVNQTLIAFLAPSDIKGTALLTWQHKSADDDQWLYLPAQGRMQRIAKGGKKNYFMGTDFTYEDLESEELDDYQYNVLREEDFEGTPCYVLEAIPATDLVKKESSYSKRLFWVSKDKFTTLKIEFYDRFAKHIKTQTNHDWENVAGTLWRPKKVLMVNHKNSHKTLTGSIQREVNKEIPEQTFTERFILKGSHAQ